MEDLLQVSEVTPVPKTTGAAKKAPKQPKTPKEPKVEAEIPQEVRSSGQAASLSLKFDFFEFTHFWNFRFKIGKVAQRR